VINDCHIFCLRNNGLAMLYRRPWAWASVWGGGKTGICPSLEIGT